MRVLLIAQSGRGARARTDTVRSRAASGIMSAGMTTVAECPLDSNRRRGNAHRDRVPGNLA